MRLIVLGVFVFFFVVLPMYALNALLLPELHGLQHMYANADQTAQAIAEQSNPN